MAGTMQLVFALVVLGLYAAACTGTGMLALRVAAGRARFQSCAQELPLIASAFVLGQAIVAMLLLAMALAGVLRVPALLALLAAGLGALAWQLGATAPRLRAQAQALLEWRREQPLLLQGVVVVALACAAAFFVAAWVAPPIGDAEAFYVTYARIIATSGRLEPMPGLYEAFSPIGLVGEMHLAALLSLSGIGAAKGFVWLIGLALACLLANLCAAAGAGRVGQLAAFVLLLSSSAFTYHLFDGKVDLFAAALALLAIRWALAADIPGLRPVALSIAGFAGGFAVVAKFSYAIAFVPSLCLLIAWREWLRTGSPLAVVQAGAIVGGAAVVAVIPHLAKNALLFGAPLAPFFGAGEGQDWLQQVWFGPEDTRWIVSTYPLALVFGRYPMQGGNLSWLWLSLLPLAALLPRPERWWRSVVVQLTVVGLLGAVLWVALRPSVIAPRYLLATLLLLFPLAVLALEQVLRVDRPPRWFSAALAAAATGALLMFVYPALSALRAAPALVLGHAHPCALASAYCAPLLQLNREAAAGDRVWIGGYYTYWMRDDLLQCRDRGAETRAQRTLKGPGTDWETLIREGFRWVLIETASHRADLAALESVPLPAGVSTRVAWRDDAVVLLEIVAGNAQAQRRCRQLAPGYWRPESAQ